MASSDQDVESLLRSRTATLIAQLNPDLTDQATRKIHGEVTVTWPYSSITKSFAFLLAEPDFRLRRDKGLVRIQLKGPSAEAAGKWELGSGDEVTLALDGVEWAKDDEPVRPAGSRCDWQLQFAGRLTLKATLGDTQETKSLHIDQPISLETAEAFHPIHLAEIDLTIFENDPIKDKAPTSPVSRAAASDGEYASPFFVKRSRASYGPMFDFEELEEETGGRSSKRHKGLHYAAVNGRWRVQEGSRSPTPESEPELVRDSPAPAQEHSGDIEMHDTPSKFEMTDEGVQTDEVDLVLGSSSPINTPSKGWSKPGTIKSSGQGVGHSFDDSRTSASLPKYSDSVAAETHGNASVPATLNPSGQVFPASKFIGFGGSTPADGAPAERREHVASQAMPAFAGQAFGSTGVARFGQAQGPSNNKLLGQMPSPFSSNPIMASITGSGQTSSLFGNASAPAQSPFLPSPSAHAGFGAPSGSVRFGFGHRSPSPSAATAFGAAQITTQDSTDPYLESSLDQQKASGYTPNISQNLFGTTLEEPHDGHRFGDYQASENQMSEQQIPLWPLGTQNFDPSHAAGHISATEDLHLSDNSLRHTPPGMIPPAVDDGTRNLDEMRHAGILSGSVYRQGVPQEALPDHGDASAGEDNESMDSDERLEYDEAEKGDDYDLRNYDCVSDDEEGFEDEEALSDDELLDEASEHWVGPVSEDEAAEGSYGRGQNDESEDGMQGHALEEMLQADLEQSMKEHPDGDSDSDEDEDEDEDDYEYDDEEVHHKASRYPSSFHAPAPSLPKKPIEVIDLLSDSEDDEPPKSQVQAPSNHFVPNKSNDPSKVEATGIFNNGSEEQDDGQVHTSQMLAPHASHPESGLRQGTTGSDVEADSSGNVGDEFYDEDEDGEDEPQPDVKESRRATEPIFDMSESSDRDEDETEVHEAIAVNNAQQNGFAGHMSVDEDQCSDSSEVEGKKDDTEVQDPVTAGIDPSIADNAPSNRPDDATAVDEKPETRLPASEDEKIGGTEGHNAVEVSELQLGSGDDIMADREDRQSNLAEIASVHEHQTEVQGDSNVDQVQLDGGDNAVAVDTGQQSNPADAEDSQAEAHQAEVHDAVAFNETQHHVVEESVSTGSEVIDDLAESLQSQTDHMLASFESHHTAATNLSAASQDQEDGDVDMKDIIVQETPQAVALESVAVRQDLENGTEQPQAEAEAKMSEDISTEDDMVVEAQQLSVREFKKTWTVEFSSDDERVEARSPTTSQPQDLANTVLTTEVTTTTVTNHVEAQLDDHQDDTSGAQGIPLEGDVASSQPSYEKSSSQKRMALEYQKVQFEAEPIVLSSMEADDTHESFTESRDVETVDAALASQSEDDIHQADAAPTPSQSIESIDETESNFAPSKDTEEIDEVREIPVEANDIDMVDAAVTRQAENDAQQTSASEAPNGGQINQVHETPEPTSSEVVQETSEDLGDSVPVPDENVDPKGDQLTDKKQHLFAQIDGSASDNGEEFHDASEMPELGVSSPATRPEESFASMDSQVSDAKQAEEPEMTPLEQPKRDNRRMTRTANAKSVRTTSVKSATATKESKRQAEIPSFRRISAQRAPSSQRTTRSKTMSFQTAKPKDKKEDMSIQAARAALKSLPAKRRRASNTTDTTAAAAINPSKRRRVSTTSTQAAASADTTANAAAAAATKSPKRRTASATSAPTTNTPSTDIARRLQNAMSNALSLKDMKKCINPRPGRTHPDFVAVATSASPTPTRTPAREYTSLFTITDPSFASDGVVQVEMFDKRSANFPELEVGDSVILRNFMVMSLRDRGFGLASRAATGSSWAVFKAGGGDDPQMKTPVEMNAKEKKYLLDLRSWYADLDEDAKGKLTEAASTMQAVGKESKARK